MDSIKILIIDDEVDFLETIVNRLNKRGYLAEGVTSGEDALERIQETDFDVLLLDVKMPGGMDGLETFKEIKKLSAQVQVIFLTGHGSLELSQEGLEMGAYDYILKPANFEELLDKINKAAQKDNNSKNNLK